MDSMLNQELPFATHPAPVARPVTDSTLGKPGSTSTRQAAARAMKAIVADDGRSWKVSDLFSFIWSPRPHIGISYNSSGDTSQAYLGLTWEWSFLDGWFAEYGLGGMIHDGHLLGVDDETKSLGCRLLFREPANVGYRFYKRHALMFHFNHSSNARLCEKNTSDGSAEGRHDVIVNEGFENVGIRYGYMF